jgi:hypothetical protein
MGSSAGPGALVLEKTVFLLTGVQPQLLGHSSRSLVTVPTALSRSQSIAHKIYTSWQECLFSRKFQVAQNRTNFCEHKTINNEVVILLRFCIVSSVSLLPCFVYYM